MTPTSRQSPGDLDPPPPPSRSALARMAARLGMLAGDDLVQRLARGGLWALLIKVAAAVLSLVMLAALARAMNAAEFGRFAFGYSLAMVLATVAGLGLHTGILRWRPENEVRGRPDLAAAAERWGINMTLAASALLAAGLMGLGWALGPRLERLAELDLAALGASAALTVALAVSGYQQSALRARGALIAALLPREVLWRGGITLAGGTLALAALQVDAAQALWISAGLLGALTATQALRHRLTPGRQADPAAPALGARGPAGTWARQAGPMWGSAVLGVLAKHFEVLVIGLFFSAEITGMYFAALYAASALTLVLVASNMVAAPLISRTHHGGERQQLQRLLRLIAAGMAGPVLIGFALMWLFAPEILSIFNPAYAEGAGLLVLLAAGMAARTLGGPTGMVLQLTGSEGAHVRIMATVTAAMIALQLTLIPIFGLWSAAAVNAGGGLIWNLWMRGACLQRVGVDPTVLSLLPRRR